MTKKPNTGPGRRIAAPWDREARAELDAVISAKTAMSPLWGKGMFSRHIVLGFFEPVSYCGRYVGDISTSPMPTLIGVVCPTCARVWNRAMDVRNARIEAGNRDVITRYRAQFVDLYEAGDLEDFRALWRKEVRDNKALRDGLEPELAERGIVVPIVLEQLRIDLGEPRSFLWEPVPGTTEAP